LAYDGTGAPEVYSHTVTGLTLDQDYSFYVTALNPDEGPASDILTHRAAALPLAPASITEVANSRTGQSISLTWPAPTDLGGSAIISYTLAIVNENQADTIVYHGASTTTIVEGLTSGQEYQFKVRATTAAGDSAWSTNTYSFLIVDEPSAPLSLEVLSFDDTFVALRWQQPLSSGGQPISTFKVYREDCSLSATTIDLLTTLSASTFQHTDSTVTAGRDYKFYVTATNLLGGESARSTAAPVTPITVPVASSAPTLVSKSK
jgi:titin